MRTTDGCDGCVVTLTVFVVADMTVFFWVLPLNVTVERRMKY